MKMTENPNKKKKISSKCRKKNPKHKLIAAIPDMTKQLNQAAADGHMKEVCKLLKNGASVHSHGPIGMNPLHQAASNGHVEICKQLITVGVVMNCFNKVGKSPLHLAAVNGHSNVVNYLLNAGASVNHQDMLLMTPLHWACDRSHIEVVSILLRHNADLSCQNKYHKTPLMLAKQKNHTDIVDYIEKYLAVIDQEMRSLSPVSTSSNESGTSEICEQLSYETEHEHVNLSSANETIRIQDHNNEPIVENEEIKLDESDGEDSKIQDFMINTLTELEEAAREGHLNKPYEISIEDATELMRAEAALLSLGDPSRTLLNAMSNGGTFHLTEAGVQALDMFKPDAFVIPSHCQQIDESEDEEELRRKTSGSQSTATSLTASNSCNAVVLHTATSDFKRLFDSQLLSPMSASTSGATAFNLEEFTVGDDILAADSAWSPTLNGDLTAVDNLMEFRELAEEFEFLPELETMSPDLLTEDLLDASFDPQHLWTELPFPSASSHKAKRPPNKKTKL